MIVGGGQSELSVVESEVLDPFMDQCLAVLVAHEDRHAPVPPLSRPVRLEHWVPPPKLRQRVEDGVVQVLSEEIVEGIVNVEEDDDVFSFLLLVPGGGESF